MPTKYFVEIGRIAMLTHGPQRGRIAAIVNIVDQNRALIDGPLTGVKRRSAMFKTLRMTKLKIKIQPNAPTKQIVDAWKKDKIRSQWHQTKMYQQIKALRLRRKMTDFDRFKLYKARQSLNRMVDLRVKQMLGSQKKEALKKKKEFRESLKPKRAEWAKKQAEKNKAKKEALKKKAKAAKKGKKGKAPLGKLAKGQRKRFAPKTSGTKKGAPKAPKKSGTGAKKPAAQKTQKKSATTAKK